MVQTLDDLRMPAPTWSDDVRAYEREKRHVIDEGLVKGQQMRLPYGHVRAQERIFDPLLQRFRDNGMEAQQRHAEEKARIGHLNRAQDTQIMREQPFHIIHNESKLEALAPGLDPMRLGEKNRNKNGKGGFPATALDYNIVTNLPFEEHHWAPPGERPTSLDRSPQERKIAQWQIKDYNIVTNKYLNDHPDKIQMEQRLNLLEATKKYNKQNYFDPVTQQYNDPRVEERVRAFEDARGVEAHLQLKAQQPPSFKGRESAYYDVLSHKTHDEDMLQVFDSVQEQCKDRFRNRYTVEHNLHVRDLRGDNIADSRKLNGIAPERFEIPIHRGYDIIENRAYGDGPNKKKIYEPLPKPRLTPWEKIEASKQLATSSSAPQLRRSPAGQDRRSPSGHDATNRPMPAAVARPAASPMPAAVATPSPAPPGRTAPPAAMMQVAPPAPTIPGSPVGSVFSRRRA